MGYHVIDPQTLDPVPDRPSETRDIQEAVGLENLGVRIYHVEPGQDIPYGGLHYHDTQEEVFYVIEGVIDVETPEEVYTVDQGQFFIAEPEHPHRAYNDGEQDARVLGVGAPKVEDGHIV